MERLPVLLGVELTCPQTNSQDECQKERKEPTKNNFGFCRRKRLILIVYREINLNFSLDIKKWHF